MRIERERYVICKKSRHGAMILCTVNNTLQWCYILHLDGEAIRSYVSEGKARQAFARHFGPWNPKRHRIVRVIETYQNVKASSKLLKDLHKRIENEDNLYDDIPNFVEPVAQYEPTGTYERGEEPDIYQYGAEEDLQEDITMAFGDEEDLEDNPPEEDNTPEE